MFDYNSNLYKNIDVEREGDVATVRIDRPEVYNAFNGNTLLDMRRCFDQFEADRDIEAVVLTGTGEDAFSSGADISEYRDKNYGVAYQEAREELVYALCERMRELHAPVVARINGHCVGGGLILAMNCDIRIAVEGAKFGVPVTNIGQIPGAGGIYRMLELVGETKTKELVLTASLVESEQAHEIGLINTVVPYSELDGTVNGVVENISATGTQAVKNSKRAINAIADAATREEAHAIEQELWLEQYDTNERRQLVEEFLNE
jgi:enoyl-CoA hydratase